MERPHGISDAAWVFALEAMPSRPRLPGNPVDRVDEARVAIARLFDVHAEPLRLVANNFKDRLTPYAKGVVRHYAP